MNAAKNSVYLDHAATTPPDPEVVRAMQDALAPDGPFGNPSSIHAAGRRARELTENARAEIARMLNADPGCIVFTSGATESDNLAIVGAARQRAHRGRHLITMRTEHKAVVDTFSALERDGWSVSWLSPEPSGLLRQEVLEAAMRPDTQLVSVMHVNNETGVIQDIEAIGRLCRSREVLFHTDAAQSAGKLPLDLAKLPVDLLSLTAHKFNGPQGIGALYLADRPGCHVAPLLHGGGQERRLRPGTLPVHQVVGFGQAALLSRERMRDDLARYAKLNDRLWRGISALPGLQRNGDREAAFPGILNVSADGVEGESLLLALAPLCVASGAACNSQTREPSYVLRALGCDDHLAQSAIRFSFGRRTTEADVDFAVDRYRHAVERLRAIAPATATTASRA